MKTRPFLLRALICFLLSMIPLQDFDRQIYAHRVALQCGLNWLDWPCPSAPASLITLPFGVRILLQGVAIWVAAWCVLLTPVWLSSLLIAGGGSLILLLLFQFFFLFGGFYLPIANIGLSLLITYLIFTGYRLAVQENLQWRSLKQAQYLRELDQMKTNFLSIVSHDLKTPVAKIQAVIERVKRERVISPEAIDSLENSNQELNHYISSILNLSRIESQKVLMNKKSNDINRLIQATIKRLLPLASHRGITLREELEPLFSIEYDDGLIRQVLTNLIDNAIKYSRENSSIIIRSREIEIPAEKRAYVEVSVQDFGTGIPEDELPLMFRKFSRFMRPVKEQVKGSGLGLYLSKYFIELHGGQIAVQSELGQGTTLTFRLPVSRIEAIT